MKLTLFPEKFSKNFPISRWFAEYTQKFFLLLDTHLKQANLSYSKKDFLAIVYSAFIFNFIIFSIVFCLLAYWIGKPFFAGFIFSFILSGFYAFRVFYTPKLIVNIRVRNIEQNLLPALEEMVIQLRSGLPLYDIIVNISQANYGEVSKEFKKVAKKVATGMKQEIALEELSETNPSLYFRRAIWQLANGIKTGSNIETIVQEIINSLGEQQAIEIQRYGSVLSPIALFYMLLGVILPVLSFTFLLIASALLAWSTMLIALLFTGFLFLILIIQLIFLGLTKSRRPPILG